MMPRKAKELKYCTECEQDRPEFEGEKKEKLIRRVVTRRFTTDNTGRRKRKQKRRIKLEDEKKTEETTVTGNAIRKGAEYTAGMDLGNGNSESFVLRGTIEQQMLGEILRELKELRTEVSNFSILTYPVPAGMEVKEIRIDCRKIERRDEHGNPNPDYKEK
jgi:hypothetical protein